MSAYKVGDCHLPSNLSANFQQQYRLLFLIFLPIILIGERFISSEKEPPDFYFLPPVEGDEDEASLAAEKLHPLGTWAAPLCRRQHLYPQNTAEFYSMKSFQNNSIQHPD